MMNDLGFIKNLLLKGKKESITREEIAQLLKMAPEALDVFEKAYQTHVIDSGVETDNLFDADAKEAIAAARKENGRAVTELSEYIDELTGRIVEELLTQTVVYSYDGNTKGMLGWLCGSAPERYITNADINKLPEAVRPQLTGNLAKTDIPEPASRELLYFYHMYKTEKDPKKRETAYHMFRQGLDILDLDKITYEILGMNPDSMGYWFPKLAEAVTEDSIFLLPATKIMKVPLTLLQLTRLDYGSLTPVTLRIVDEFCFRAFDLDEEKDYFVKTGTYSSKYNFRNAHVVGAKEVRELGEYLLFIQNQACMAAGPLSQPCIYGMSTTNEWVVREYIKDKENNPCIYKGMPLHTEYRVFVDFDTNEILGMTPYWRADIMKQRFGHQEDADSPHNIHDYAIFLVHEDTLLTRYQENKRKVLREMGKLIPRISLQGQWSIDIMQNGDDFYIIDMALAEHSALSDCVSAEKIKHIEVDWMPKLCRNEIEEEGSK